MAFTTENPIYDFVNNTKINTCDVGLDPCPYLIGRRPYTSQHNFVFAANTKPQSTNHKIR